MKKYLYSTDIFSLGLLINFLFEEEMNKKMNGKNFLEMQLIYFFYLYIFIHFIR